MAYLVLGGVYAWLFQEKRLKRLKTRRKGIGG
jgi:hypothetical protein